MENTPKYTLEKGAQTEMAQIQQKIDEFYNNNPGVAEAMKLFQISYDQYYNSVMALNKPIVCVSNSSKMEVNRGYSVGKASPGNGSNSGL